MTEKGRHQETKQEQRMETEHIVKIKEGRNKHDGQKDKLKKARHEGSKKGRKKQNNQEIKKEIDLETK